MSLFVGVFFLVTGINDYFVIFGMFPFLIESHHKFVEGKCPPGQVFYVKSTDLKTKLTAPPPTNHTHHHKLLTSSDRLKPKKHLAIHITFEFSSLALSLIFIRVYLIMNIHIS